MSKCVLCKKEHQRLLANSKTIPARYCSVQCIKKAYYFRNSLNKKSLGKSKLFWKTETGIGYKWEMYVAKILGGKHLPFNKNGVDVTAEIDGTPVNLDVKVCNKYKNQWVFNKNKPKTHIDYYFCICLDDNHPTKMFLIPTQSFTSCGITVGNKSKYDKFIFQQET